MEFRIQIYVLVQNIILMLNVGIQILLRKYGYKFNQKFIRIYLGCSAIIISLLMLTLVIMMFRDIRIDYLIIHMVFSIIIFGYCVMANFFVCTYITLNEQLCLEDVTMI